MGLGALPPSVGKVGARASSGPSDDSRPFFAPSVNAAAVLVELEGVKELRWIRAAVNARSFR